MTRGRAGLAVVHLVRSGNQRAATEAFLSSYEAHPAGAEHELVLLCKGFPDEQSARWLAERAADHRPRVLHVSDEGLDLSAYLQAGTRLPHTRLCFVNSYSEILAPGWLAALADPVQRTRAGAAGATGSWASSYGFKLWQLGFPGGYADVFADRGTVRRTMHEISGARFRNDWLYTLGNAFYTLKETRATASLFPTMHLRTNAFVVDRELLLGLRTGTLRTKLATYRLENGRSNLTAQLRAAGRAPVVVDRHGQMFHPPEWSRANVLWQERQQDLLVADNQTRSYAQAPPAHRAVLSGFAWGPHARPALGGNPGG